MNWLSFSRLSGCVAGLLLANAAMAGEDPRVSEHQQAMTAYAQKAGKAAPVVKQYEYGERLDIVKMIGMTDSVSSCGLIPMAMTFEDSSGELTTVLYSSLGNCPN